VAAGGRRAWLGNEELQHYTDSIDNATLDGAGPDPQLAERRVGGCRFTSARPSTKDRAAFAYGLMQARIQVPEVAGSCLPSGCWARTSTRSAGQRAVRSTSWRTSARTPTVVHGTVHGPGYASPGGITASYRSEADHGRLKAWLRPMRGLKQDRSARVVLVGHAFVQNVRRGQYELAR
jgi:hypothetical protein